MRARRPGPFSGLGFGGGGGFVPVAITKLFNTVTTTSAAAYNASAAEMIRVDLATAAANVVITMPASATIGQAIGVMLTTQDDAHGVSFAGPVSSGVLSMYTTGDWQLFVWDGTTWRRVGYDVAPGLLDDLGSSANLVGLYRLFGRANYLTDYSGNTRTLVASATAKNAEGCRQNGLSTWCSGLLATQSAAAFQLQAAMSIVLLCKITGWATASVTFLACGIPGAASATNLQWSIGLGSGSLLQYFSESGAGVDNVFTASNASALAPGWHVIAMTRSAGQVVKFYDNGALLDTSAALTAPTGGGSSVVGVSAYSNGSFAAASTLMQQFGIWSTELSASQVQRATQQCLGAHG